MCSTDCISLFGNKVKFDFFVRLILLKKIAKSNNLLIQNDKLHVF